MRVGPQRFSAAARRLADRSAETVADTKRRGPFPGSPQGRLVHVYRSAEPRRPLFSEVAGPCYDGMVSDAS